MGVRSTMDITRHDAMAEIMRHLLSASDCQIENILEELVGEANFMNFRIVTAYNADNEGGWERSYDKYGLI